MTGSFVTRTYSVRAEVFGVRPGAPEHETTSALQRALYEAGIVSLTAPGTYTVNDTLVMLDGTRLVLGMGVYLTAGSSLTDPIIENDTGAGDIAVSGDGVIVCTSSTVPSFVNCANFVCDVRIEDADGRSLAYSATSYDAQVECAYFKDAEASPLAIFCKMTDGQFLCTDLTTGFFGTKLFKLDGDPLGDYTTTLLANTNVANLKNDAGSTISGASLPFIWLAWETSDGAVFFVVGGGTPMANKNYLYRATPTTYTVGNNASTYDNLEPVLEIGTLGGTHHTNIKAFTNRNFCEATVAGVTLYLFVEYNVASGRVDGTGNDVCRIWQSSDGISWTALWTVNNDGSNHRIDHFHAVKQNPHNKWIYFFTGDSEAESAIIAWDGSSAAPADNATLATFASTSGWKIITGTELARWTDGLFDPLYLYSIPDADTETANTGTVAYVGVQIPTYLEYVASMDAVTRTDNIPPALCLKCDGFDMVVSFKGANAGTYIHVWTSIDRGRTWVKAAHLRNYKSAATLALPGNVFQDSVTKRIYIVGSTGTQFTSDTQSMTSWVLFPTKGKNSALPTVFE